MVHLAIAVGGVAGAFARYGTGAVVTACGATLFPWGTLAVNILGSLALGLLMQLLTTTTLSAALRGGLTVGFCGGVTTFSTFAYETVALARGGQLALAGTYVVASLFFGVVAMLAGLEIGAAIARWRRDPHGDSLQARRVRASDRPPIEKPPPES